MLAGRGGKEGVVGAGKGPQNGQLNLSMGPAKMFTTTYKELPFQVRGLTFIKCLRIPHAIFNSICLFIKEIYSFMCRLRKPRDKDNGTCVYSWLSGLYGCKHLKQSPGPNTMYFLILLNSPNVQYQVCTVVFCLVGLFNAGIVIQSL